MSILIWGLWHAWWELAPGHVTRVELLVRAVSDRLARWGTCCCCVLVSLFFLLFIVLSIFGARSFSELILVHCPFLWVCSCSLAQWYGGAGCEAIRCWHKFVGKLICVRWVWLPQCKVDAILALLIFLFHRMFKCIYKREVELCIVRVSDNHCSALDLPPRC